MQTNRQASLPDYDAQLNADPAGSADIARPPRRSRQTITRVLTLVGGTALFLACGQGQDSNTGYDRSYDGTVLEVGESDGMVDIVPDLYALPPGDPRNLAIDKDLPPTFTTADGASAMPVEVPAGFSNEARPAQTSRQVGFSLPMVPFSQGARAALTAASGGTGEASIAAIITSGQGGRASGGATAGGQSGSGTPGPNRDPSLGVSDRQRNPVDSTTTTGTTEPEKKPDSSTTTTTVQEGGEPAKNKEDEDKDAKNTTTTTAPTTTTTHPTTTTSTTAAPATTTTTAPTTTTTAAPTTTTTAAATTTTTAASTTTTAAASVETVADAAAEAAKAAAKDKVKD